MINPIPLHPYTFSELALPFFLFYLISEIALPKFDIDPISTVGFKFNHKNLHCRGLEHLIKPILGSLLKHIQIKNSLAP